MDSDPIILRRCLITQDQRSGLFHGNESRNKLTQGNNNQVTAGAANRMTPAAAQVDKLQRCDDPAVPYHSGI
jgi:hypothetical protein